MNFEAFAKAIQSEELRTLFRHWNERRGSRLMPGWGDLRPSAIKSVLPNIWAWKYDRATERFTVRLAGDQINKVFGNASSGKPMEECFSPPYYRVVFPLFKRIVGTPEFFREHGPVYGHLGSTCLGERIALPLADDGVVSDGIVGATVYELNRPMKPEEEALAGQTEEWYSLD